MKFRRILLQATLLLLMLLPARLTAQNLIGYSEQQIVAYMPEAMPGFVRQQEIVNRHFKYLKYESSNGDQTLLLFLDDKGRCKEVRLMFDRSRLDEKVKDYNAKFTRAGDNVWTERKGRKDYLISLKDETWYYTVTITAITKQD